MVVKMQSSIGRRHSMALVIQFLLLLLPHPTNSKHTPFGYQSDSTSTANKFNNDNDDPSTFAGSIHYDSLHHALYLTGATYAPDIFDGKTTAGVGIPEDEIHVGDLGIPNYAPQDKADCFYAVVGLPVEEDNLIETIPGIAGIGSGSNSGNGFDEPPKPRVKIVHSRRFGAQTTEEACSTIDILFASPDDNAPGGYKHEFETLMEEHTVPPALSPMNVLPTVITGGTPEPTVSAEPSSSTYEPTFTNLPTVLEDDFDFDGGSPSSVVGQELEDASSAPSSSAEPSSSTYPPTVSNFPTASAEPTSSKYPPTGSDFPTASAEPSSSTYVPTGSDFPTASAYPSSSTYPPTGSNSPTPSAGLDTNWTPSPPTLTTSTTATTTTTTTPEYSDFGDGFGKRTLQGIVQNNDNDNNDNDNLLGSRSVRLLMAGHVESPTRTDGYLISDLTKGKYNEDAVYAFAQQVDVRLPNLGPLSLLDNGGDNNDTGGTDGDNTGDDAVDYHYTLHDHAQEEGTPLGNDSGGIVTSGVEARALLNDALPKELETAYPVSLVADPTSKQHFYVALLASEKTNENSDDNTSLHLDPTIGAGASQRSKTDYNWEERNTQDFFGKKGRPRYGSNYRIIVKKVSIESVDPACTSLACKLSDTEEELASTSFEEEKIAMRHGWTEQFAPDFGEDARPAGLLYVPSGEADGKGDILIMAGTTAGMGSAFGTNLDQAALLTENGKVPTRFDLDGFLTKIRPDTGAFVGHDKFDPVGGTFSNMHSHRVESLPGKDDIIAGLCAKPLRQVGIQDPMKYIYVVGSTAGVLPAITPGVRDADLLSKLVGQEGSDGMEAFLFKIDLDTMNPVWTVQVGAVFPRMNLKGDAFGYGCAVTPDGEDVYLTGLVKRSAVVTDFSSSDIGDNTANGGSDIFLASYSTNDGSQNFLRQFGSTRDDSPSRDNGGISTDIFGNAILTGNTRGSLMRERDSAEYKYGPSTNVAASDVFIMSFVRGTGEHVSIVDDGTPPLLNNNANVNAPAPAPVSSELLDEQGGARVFTIAVLLVFSIGAVTGMILLSYQVKRSKKLERQNNSKDIYLVGRRKSLFSHPTLDKFEDLDIMVEVRASASGGWHGVYDLPEDESGGTIDFGPSAVGNVPHQSLFDMEDGLKEIENSEHHISIDDFDVSEQDLIDAYNDHIEEDYDFDQPDTEDDRQFSMPSMGSTAVDDLYSIDDEHMIT